MATQEYTVKFEAQLVSTSMTANGGHKVTLRINPQDILDGQHLDSESAASNGRVRSLMTQSPNTRYMCVLVQLGSEDDEPVLQPDAEEANRAIAKMSMLCRSSSDWQRWLGVDGESEALELVKLKLGIESRSDLKSTPGAVSKFQKMVGRFYSE